MNNLRLNSIRSFKAKRGEMLTKPTEPIKPRGWIGRFFLGPNKNIIQIEGLNAISYHAFEAFLKEGGQKPYFTIQHARDNETSVRHLQITYGGRTGTDGRGGSVGERTVDLVDIKGEQFKGWNLKKAYVILGMGESSYKRTPYNTAYDAIMAGSGGDYVARFKKFLKLSEEI